MTTKTSTSRWYLWLLFGALFGIGLTIFFGKGCILPKPITHNLYKSDTVTIKDTMIAYITDTIHEAGAVEVLPEHVKIYEDTSEDRAKDYVSTGTDTATHWAYTPCYGYNQRYLSYFRSSPKLIDGDFFSDTIRLTILDTSGKIVQRTWPVSYNVLKYYYRNGNLIATPSQPRKSFQLPKTIQTEGNVYGAYSPIWGGFVLSADYSVMKGSWGLYGYGELKTYSGYTDIRLGVKHTF